MPILASSHNFWWCALPPTSVLVGRLFFCTHPFPRRLLWLLEDVGQNTEQAHQIFFLRVKAMAL